MQPKISAKPSGCAMAWRKASIRRVVRSDGAVSLSVACRKSKTTGMASGMSSFRVDSSVQGLILMFWIGGIV